MSRFVTTFSVTGSSSLSSDTAAAKIVELSKKVRELNASLETKKTEAKQLFGRCRHLENEVSATRSLSSIIMPFKYGLFCFSRCNFVVIVTTLQTKQCFFWLNLFLRECLKIGIALKAHLCSYLRCLAMIQISDREFDPNVSIYFTYPTLTLLRYHLAVLVGSYKP